MLQNQNNSFNLSNETTAKTDLPHVAILMCTYNAECYLAEQLDSLLAQTHSNLKIWISDDGSTDNTLSILEDYLKKWGSEKFAILKGPKKGFAANFLSLVCTKEICADYYAFSDQDDVWDKSKLEKALNILTQHSADTPLLYCARSEYVNADNTQTLGFSPLFTKPPSFSNALVQSIGGGNTMVFNEAARKLIAKDGHNIDIISHDWWSYLVISGCGGKVFYDSKPLIRYRQHEKNIIGMNSSFFARFKRIKLLMQGRFQNWNTRHIKALETFHSELTSENKIILDKFTKARDSGFFSRINLFKKIGIYRQTLLGNLGLLLAVICKKI